MSSHPSVTMLFLILSTTLWACEGGSDTASEGSTEAGPETATEEVAPEETPAIAGSTLTTTLTAEEAAAAQDSGAAGTWDLDLAEDGTFTVSRGQEVAVQGSYRIEADRITFIDESGPVMCEDPEGTYRWQVSGDQVTMTSVNDNCPGRRAVLTTHALAMR